MQSTNNTLHVPRKQSAGDWQWNSHYTHKTTEAIVALYTLSSVFVKMPSVLRHTNAVYLSNASCTLGVGSTRVQGLHARLRTDVRLVAAIARDAASRRTIPRTVPARDIRHTMKHTRLS